MILPHRKTRLGRQAQFRQSSAQNLPKLLLTGICTISKGRHLGLNSSQLNRIVNAKYLRLFWNPTTPFIYCKVIVSSNRRDGVEVECSPRMREIGLDPRLQQTSVVKTGSDNSTAKHSATVVSVTGPRRWPLSEHRSNFAVLHRQWLRFNMSEKILSGTINSEQTNKQTNRNLPDRDPIVSPTAR